MGKTAESVLKSARENNEPVFVFRAKDMLSLEVLQHYYYNCEVSRCNPEFMKDLEGIIHDFINWRADHRTQIKIPD